MNRMTFIKSIEADIEILLHEKQIPFELKTEFIEKLQNQSYDALLFRIPSQNISMTINLDQEYERYRRLIHKKDAYQDILDEIMEKMTSYMQQELRVDLDLFTDYEKARQYLYMDLIGLDGNERVIKCIPHRRMENLIIIYRILVQNCQDSMQSVLVNTSLMNGYQVNEEQLFQDASANSCRLFPMRFEGISDILAECTGESKEAFLMDGTDHQFVLTNQRQFHGAAVLFYPGTMESIATQLNQSYYILPSSIHECIIIPENQIHVSEKEMECMVQEINQSHVRKEERLSNSVYFYDWTLQTFAIVKNE